MYYSPTHKPSLWFVCIVFKKIDDGQDILYAPKNITKNLLIYSSPPPPQQAYLCLFYHFMLIDYIIL